MAATDTFCVVLSKAALILYSWFWRCGFGAIDCCQRLKQKHDSSIEGSCIVAWAKSSPLCLISCFFFEFLL